MQLLLCVVATLFASGSALLQSRIAPSIAGARLPFASRHRQITTANNPLRLSLSSKVANLVLNEQSLLSKDLSDIASAVELVETVTDLTPMSVLELSVDNSIVFGNYVEKKDNSNAIRVRFASGTEAWIDGAQVVSVWDTLGDEAPTSSAEWTAVLHHAEQLLNQSVPRKSTLDEFWYLISQQRSSALPVDSQDVGVYLFQESKFSQWKDPTVEAEAAKVRPLTAAQRAAAAMLLHLDGAVHFKRRPSIITESTDDAGEESVNTVRVTEGGYKIVDESIVCFKECEMFVQYYAPKETESSADSAQESPVIRRLLRQMELYALCSSNSINLSGAGKRLTTIAPAPKVIKMILKKLSLRVTPLSAQSVLVKLGQRSSSLYNPVYSNLSRVMSANRAPGSTVRNRKIGDGDKLVSEGSSGEEVEEGSVAYTLNLTPWPAAVLAEAVALKADVDSQRRRLDDTAPVSVGKRGEQGRMDYRLSASTHPAVCIDTKYASFLDDAFSLSPETGELLIHVVDVAGKLRQYPELLQAAKERISTSFLPSGPLHMLPPAALESLSLSASSANEAITVALSVNYDTGEVLSYRVFPSTLGPVVALDIHTANEIIAGLGVKSDAFDASGDYATDSDERRCGPVQSSVDDGPTAVLPVGKVKGHSFGSQDPLSTDQSTRLGYSHALVRDLRTAYNLITKMCARQPWLDASLRRNGKQNSEWQIDHQQGVVYRQELSSVHSHRLVNALLSLYATSAYQYCKDNNVPVPLAWENRDKVDSSKPRRFATQPLRNWLSQLQQKQVRAALKMELPLSQKECALAVSHHNQKRRQQAGVVGRANAM